MIFLAGEVCVDYSLRLKRELDSRRIWVNAYSNDFGCYIPSERLVREGGYGARRDSTSRCRPRSRAAEQQIIDEVLGKRRPHFTRSPT